MIQKLLGLGILCILLMATTVQANVYSQPSINANDFRFIKVDIHPLQGIDFVQFELCNEEPFDCEPLGTYLYPIDILETLLNPEVLRGKDLVLQTSPIDAYLAMLTAVLKAYNDNY